LVSCAALCAAVALAGQARADSNMYANEVLYANQYKHVGYCYVKLVMQGDGNLVEYAMYGSSNWVPAWWSNTAGGRGAYAIMQSDGNFVIYGWGGAAVWRTNTSGNYGAHLSVQSDANLVVYRSDNHPLWWSNTAGDVACWTTFPPTSPVGSFSTQVLVGYDRPGYDYWAFPVSPASGHACGYFCAQDPTNCKAWTWVPSGSMCWLKYQVPGLVYSPGMVSGTILH
jgi:hypothetical protein